MHREPAFLTESSPHRPHIQPGHEFEPRLGEYPSPALLIQAPRTRPVRRPSPAATARVRAHGASGFPGRTRKRRLRREVRLAGYVLATVFPLAIALALLAGSPARSGVGRDAHSASAVEARPPAVSITLDPGVSGSLAEPESPVVFPGYLLPDEGAEEPAHAGG